MTLDDTVHYREDPPDIDRYPVGRHPYMEVLTPEGVIHAVASVVRGDMISVTYPVCVLSPRLSTGRVNRWVHRSLVREIRRADSIWKESASAEDHDWHEHRDTTITHRPDETRPRPQLTTPDPGPAMSLERPEDLCPPGWNGATSR